MAADKQIIGFIDPSKFASLLGMYLPDNYRQNGSFLENGNKLVYIQTNGTCEVSSYNGEKAKAASIVLVPDTFDFQYTPDLPFKVLFHSQTDESNRVQRLREINNHFQGDEKSQEVDNTPYQKIADLIKAALNKEKTNVTFESIYMGIMEFDEKEESLTEAIFSAIYEHKNEDEIEKLVNERDRYIKGKIK